MDLKQNKDKTESYPNSMASRKSREQLKINFTTATLFKVSSNYVRREFYYHIVLFCSLCKSSFLLVFLTFFSALKLKDVRIIWSFETFWFIKRKKVQVISSLVPDSVTNSISFLSLATNPPPIKISVIYISIAASFSWIQFITCKNQHE